MCFYRGVARISKGGFPPTLRLAYANTSVRASVALHARACSPTKIVSRAPPDPAVTMNFVTIASHNNQFEVPTTHSTCTSSYADCYNTFGAGAFPFRRMNPAHFFARRGVSGQPETPPGYAPGMLNKKYVHDCSNLYL